MRGRWIVAALFMLLKCSTRKWFDADFRSKGVLFIRLISSLRGVVTPLGPAGVMIVRLIDQRWASISSSHAACHDSEYPDD
jgi:uncharacterized membrane protein